MARVSLRDFDCHYQFDDFGNRQVIVLFHSLGTDLHMWERQVDVLSHHFNILRYDTRGHGASGSVKSAFDLADLGRDVIALLEWLKIDEPVYFCGLSLGGLVGQWLGINEPHRLKKLILSNTAAKIGSDSIWNERIKTVNRHGLEGLTESVAQRWFTEKLRISQPQIMAAVLSRFIQTDPRGYVHYCAAIRDADFREQLRQLEVPAFLISGDKDAVTTTADAEFMAERIPDVRHATIHAAHLSNLEKPEEFSKFILFFAEH